MRIDWDALIPVKPAEKEAEAGAGETALQADKPAPDAGIVAREGEGDNRRRCTECRNLGERGVCLAAQRREIVASRSYAPVRDILRRCEGFAPLPTDPDQRHGRDRWPGLTDSERVKDATL